MPFAFHRLGVAAVAALFAAGSAFAAGPQARNDPTTPVAALYAVEKAGRPALGEAAVRAATLTRGLAALYDKAKAVELATGDVLIDFDAVTNSQGAEVKSYALKTERRDATHASVVATIDPGDWLRASPRENVIRFALVLESGRWRIDDVSGVAEPSAWSLRDVLDHNLRQP
jgi:hypothetical protein